MISMYAEYSGRTLYVCLSTDNNADDFKGAKNGDTMYHMDTGKRYVYNDVDKAFHELPEEGGGGSGGGSGDYVAEDWLFADKPVGPIVSNATHIMEVALQYRTAITDVVLTEATVIPPGFARNSSITSFVAPKLVTIGERAFQNTENLNVAVFLPNAELSANCFDASSVPIVVCKGGIGGKSNALKGNTHLTTVDFVNPSNMGVQTFANCTNFNKLICRGNAVPIMNNINNVSNTPFASGKTGGTLYVPQDMISAYQAANNWSTILGYPNNKILPIEGSVYESQYADGTPIQ